MAEYYLGCFISPCFRGRLWSAVAAFEKHTARHRPKFANVRPSALYLAVIFTLPPHVGITEDLWFHLFLFSLQQTDTYQRARSPLACHVASASDFVRNSRTNVPWAMSEIETSRAPSHNAAVSSTQPDRTSLSNIKNRCRAVYRSTQPLDPLRSKMRAVL